VPEGDLPMKNRVQKFVLFALVLAIALPLAAAEREKKKAKKKGEGRADQVAQMLAKLKKLDLPEETTAKIKELGVQYREKMAECRKVLQPVQKAMAEARKQATAAGKKGKELRQAVEAAVELTEEQKQAMAKLRELNMQMRKEIMGLLTPEQRKAAGLQVRKGGGKKKKAE
jgi:Spy/CpxP family protein refolding chaperone